MTELQELIRQKREIEKKIKILTTGSIIEENVKIDKIGCPMQYQHGKWALFYKYRFVASRGREGKAEERSKWVPLFNGDSFYEILKRMPEVINELTEIFENAKGEIKDE